MNKIRRSDHQAGLGRLDAAGDQEKVDHLEVGQDALVEGGLPLAVFFKLAAGGHIDGVFDQYDRIVVHGAPLSRDHDALVGGLVGLDAARKGMGQQLVPLVDLVAHRVEDLVEGTLLIQHTVFGAVFVPHSWVICDDDEIQFPVTAFIPVCPRAGLKK